jgi:N-methylhydantoinase A/oxoprolinase/acetone carboxylase beta subunit
MNAYLAPVMGRYLNRLGDGLASKSLRVMQSNGGTVQAQTAAEFPVTHNRFLGQPEVWLAHFISER